MHVLPEVGSDQHETVGVLDVYRFRRFQCVSERQLVTDLTWSLTLVIRRVSRVGCTHRLGQVLEVSLCRTMCEKRDRTRPVSLDDLAETSTDLSVRLVPADIPEYGLTSLTCTYLWLFEAVFALPETDSTNTSGTEFAPAERVSGDRTDMERFAFVTDLNVDTALPEAHSTDRPDGVHRCWREVAGVIDIGCVGRRGWFAIKQDTCGDACCPNEAVAKKVTPRQIIGTHVAPIGKNSLETYIRSH